METVIEKRHKKFRARIKAHFEKKRAAKASASREATAGQSTAGKTLSYFKGKSTVADLGHKPSKAKQTATIAKLRAANVVTAPKATPAASFTIPKPKATPNSAAKAPKIKAPAAAKADPSNTTALGRKAQFVAAGIAVAATGTAAFLGSVTKLPKSTPKVKAPTGELAIQKGGLAIQKGELAIKTPAPKAKPVATKKATLTARHDARRAKQGADVRYARESFERADARKAAELTVRHGARRAKQGTSLRHAFEGAERADARAATPKPPMVKPPTVKPPTAPHKIEATGVGFYDEANLKKVDQRAAERRLGEATRRQPGRLKKGTYADLDKTVQRDIAPQRGNRRKPSSDPRQGAEAAKAKPPTKAAIQTDIDTTKGQITRLRGVQGVEMGVNPPLKGFSRDARIGDLEAKIAAEPSGLNQKERDARIADLEKKLAKPTATGPKIPESPKKPEVPKQTTAVPRISKPEAQRQYKELMLETPRTVSEGQKQKADRKFYNDRNARISEVANPTKASNVPGRIATGGATDLASVAEARRRVVTNRIAELEIELAPKSRTHTPELRTPTTTANAAARAGVSEASVQKAAVKVPTLEAPGSITVQPKNKQAAKPITQQSRGLPTRSAGFESGEAPPKENIRTLVKEVRAKAVTTTASTGKEALGRAVANKIHTQDTADAKRGAELDTKIKSLEAQLETKPEETAPKPKGGEQLPRSQPKTRVVPSVSDMKLEQEGAKVKTPAPAPKATKAQATAVKTPQTAMEGIAKSFQNYAARVAKGASVITNPAIGANVKSKVKAGVKGGAVLTALFAGLGGIEAGAKENDPGKRVKTGLAATKKSAKEVALEIGAYTGTAKLAALAGGAASSALFFGTVLPAVATYKIAKDFTIPKLKELGTQIGELKYAKNAARLEKKGSEKKYGTIEAATKTRHAKEAVKKAKTKNKSKDLLTG